MIEFIWNCPNCGTRNTGDAGHAQDYTEECENCKKEYEVICDIAVDVTEINEVRS